MAFLGVPIRRGEVIRQRVPIGELADSSPLNLPIVTIAGKQDGPTFHIQAAVHGDELTGVEVCREVIRRLNPETLRGTVVAVPVTNVAAYLTRSRGWLNEERGPIDFNRSYPGNPHGLLTERVVSTLFSEFISAADYSIDLHSALAGCDIAPFSYVDPDDDENGTLAAREKMAYAMGARLVYCKKRGAKLGTSDMTRAVSTQADLIGKPMITVEMGESNKVSWDLVPFGADGVINILRAVEMLPEPVQQFPEPRRFSRISPLHASRGGGLKMHVRVTEEVKAGQTIAEVVDVFGDLAETITAPHDGVVLRVMNYGTVSTGAEVSWVVD